MVRATLVIAGIFALGVVSGCSTVQGKPAAEISKSGPTVLNGRVNPGTIELNRELKPMGPAEVLVEVTDFSAPVNDVRLRFVDIRQEVKMEKLGGSTWRAVLPPELLKRLAIGNQTTVYNANIYAKNTQGVVGTLEEPIKVAVKAPDLSKSIS